MPNKMPTISVEFDFKNWKSSDSHPNGNAFATLHVESSFNLVQHESGNFLLLFGQSFGWIMPQQCN